jgi:hypothetical protein
MAGPSPIGISIRCEWRIVLSEAAYLPAVIAGLDPIGIRLRCRRRIVLPETPCLPVVIAGLDPVIPADIGGCGGARIKSGHDDERMDCLCPHLILMPMGLDPVIPSDSGGCGGARIKPGMTGRRFSCAHALILMHMGLITVPRPGTATT